MQNSTKQGSQDCMNNFGILMPAQTYCERFGAPPTGAPRSPVLTANFNISRIDAAIAVRRASFGVYCIPGPDVNIIAVRQQLGPIQNFWLADSGDPEISQAVESWRKTEWVHVAFFERGDAFSGKNGVRCCVHRSHSGKGQIDTFLRESKQDNSAKFLDFAGRLITTKSIERTTTSDLDGIALTDVQVNILATKRLSRFQNPEDAKPNTVGSLVLG
ncbi:hypothetical protein [Paraburkholderia flagellata]|uniref:hypothetical protein n=1 Tax=Paraburkholderia flagellata TaxID=2883241 RepID=UPI001F346820|nr:hypothetical protein [Paraburkholderia flagellata]